MLQVPAEILNNIAKTQTLRSQWATNLFSMNQQELNQQDQEQYSQMVQAGTDSTVAKAYQAVAPLLMENVAISKYIQQTEQPELRSCLPEIATVNEAIYLASKEYTMTAAQQTQLKALLSQLKA
jgi:hypothetical protein